MPHVKVAVAGIPGAWSSEVLVESLKSLGAESFLVPIWECVHDLNVCKVLWKGQDLSDLDGMMVKKMGDLDTQYTENRIVMLRELQDSGVAIASSPGAIDDAVNRYRNSWLLRRAGLPMPKTVLAESPEAVEEVVQSWSKVVLKPLFTTKARGMRILESNTDIRPALTEFQEEGRGPFYLQEFVNAPGRDIAVAIMGDSILGAYYRVAKPGNWKTTTNEGGHYEPCELSDEGAEMALSAASVFGLDFTSVDLVETEEGLLTYEVSAFGGFSGLRKAHGIDAARLYAEYFLKKLDNERN
jgi:ribosomal protein S6--L-glutamate ligase